MGNDPKKDEAKTANAKKRLPIGALAIIDNMVFNKQETMAYYQLTNNVFDFLSNDQKVAMAMRISNALNNLMTDKQEPIDCHIIVTSVPVDIDTWAETIAQTAKDWESGPGFEDYLMQQVIHLKQHEYLKKVTYLGVSLGKRGALNFAGLNVFESGVKGAMETMKTWLDTALKMPSAAISAKEEDSFRRKEAELFRTLSNGHLQAERVTSEDLLLRIKRQLYPAMPAPYLNVDHDRRIGPGDIDLEVSSAIENKFRWLKITQMIDNQEVSGYRANLTFAKFPKETYYPGVVPFFYMPYRLGAAFTCYSRFTLYPNQKMKLELEKKKKEKKDELENMSVGQNAFDSAVDGMPSEVSESLEDMSRLSQMLAADKTPWVEGSYHVVVEAPDEATLRNFCSTLKQEYDDSGILLQWTAGDQAKLFLEEMPGALERINTFKQITNLDMISTSGMNFSSDVGDPIAGTN